MNTAIRMILTLALSLALAVGLFAQETAEPTTTAPGTDDAVQADPAEAAGEASGTALTESETATAEATTDESRPTNYEVREEFGGVLLAHSYDVATVLAFDPDLLKNEEFLARYPDLQQFVAEHPEIQRNPRFYMAEFLHRRQRGGVLEDIVEPILIFTIFAFIALALAWLIRTIIEQKRWNRLSRIQTEVHNKILDRFSTSEELLNYVRSAAGTKFLESAPIPLRDEQPRPNAPMARIMWSIQLGVVAVVASLGMLLVSFRFEEHAAEDLFAFGVIGFCLGVGFIASAAVSLALSKRLGLWQEAEVPPRHVSTTPLP